MKLLSFSITLLIALTSFVQTSTASETAACPANFEQNLTGNKSLDNLLTKKFTVAGESNKQFSNQKPVLDLVAKLSLINMAKPGDKLRIALKNVNNSDVFYYIGYLLLLKANSGVNVEVVVQNSQSNPNSLLLNHVIQSPNISVYMNNSESSTNAKLNSQSIRFDMIELNQANRSLAIRSNNSLKWASKDVIFPDAATRNFSTHGEESLISVQTEFSLISNAPFSFDLLSDKSLAEKDPSFKLTQTNIELFYQKANEFANKLRANIPRNFKRPVAPLVFEVNGIHQAVDTYERDPMASTALDFVEFISNR